jgi:predicted transcriptional regulator
MQRKTSTEAYAAVMASEELGHTQKEAYKLLFTSGPLTGSELSAKSGLVGLHKRLSELCEAGVVEKVGIRICTHTGRKAYIWDVTRALPLERIQYKSKYEEARATIDHLERKVQALEQQLKDGIPTEPGGQTRLL